MSTETCKGEWAPCPASGVPRFHQCARAVLLGEPLPPDAGDDVGLALCLDCIPDRPPPGPGEPVNLPEAA
jgi:hypothetical protein